MRIGVPRESYRHEHRVGLSPYAAAYLVQRGHEVLVGNGAGESSHFTNEDYERAGGQIVFNAEEVYRRTDMVCRVGMLSSEELDLVDRGSVICGFHHLAVMPREHVHRLMELETTLVGYEIIRDEQGDLPVLHPFSEMAGRLAVQLAAYYLQTEAGGRGILMGNVPGIPPPTVLILGAGTVGRTAAREAMSTGSHVILMDSDLRKLTRASRDSAGQVVTVVASEERLARYTAISDVVIGAILIPGARAPFLVTESMVKAMKRGSVVIDASIDQGGCIETSRPTTLDNPVFVAHGVIHYCVPNMTANVARTASRALVNAGLPYVAEIADAGLERALRDDPGLGRGLYLYRGNMVNERVGQTLGIAPRPLPSVQGDFESAGKG